MDRPILECFPSGKVFGDLGILKQIPPDSETTCCSRQPLKIADPGKVSLLVPFRYLLLVGEQGLFIYSPAGQGRVLQKTD